MQRTLLAAVAVLFLSCGDQPEPLSITRQAAFAGETITVIKGAGQLGLPNMPLPKNVRFVMRTAGGTPIAGARGTIAVSSGGGSVNNTAFKTTPTGEFTFSWTLGSADAQIVTITANATGATATANAVVVPVGSELQIFAGDNQIGAPGDTLGNPVRARLVDPSLTPLAGVTVNFTIQDGSGGGVRNVSLTTNSSGNVSNFWKLGWGKVSQQLVASVPGVDSAVFNATADTAGMTFTIVSGNSQDGTPNMPLSQNLVVILKDASNQPIANAEGVWSVEAGGGSLTRSAFTTTSLGRAVTKWTLGQNGIQQVKAKIGGLDSLIFTATIPTIKSNYDFQVFYMVPPTPSQQAAVEAAVERWRMVITGDLPDVSGVSIPAVCGFPANNATIDDIRLWVDFRPIDGPGNTVASSGVCLGRNNFLPLISGLTIDGDDIASIEAAGGLYNLILHEIGHAVGVGTSWDGQNLITGGTGDDPVFTGPSAITAFNSLGGSSYVGARIPIQCTSTVNCGSFQSSVQAHWRESVMGDELMTSELDLDGPMPLSLITISSLQDIGYLVSTASADAYFVGAALRVNSTKVAKKIREAPWPWKLILLPND